MATTNHYPAAYFAAAGLNRALAAIGRDPGRYQRDDLVDLYGLILRTAARLSAVLLLQERSPMLETRIENFRRAEQALHTLTSHRQAIIRERANLEAEIAELESAITQTSNALQNPPLNEIRELRAKLKELTEQRTALTEALAIPALSTDEIDHKINAATTQVNQLRKIVFGARLDELLNEPDAQNARAILSRIEALRALANVETPNLIDKTLVEQERQAWITWLQ